MYLGAHKSCCNAQRVLHRTFSRAGHKMSNEQPPGVDADNSIQPTSPEGRVFSTLSYVLMWWSSLIVVQAFALGQGMLPPIGKLNLMQSLLIMALAGGIFVVMLSLNGQPG